MGTLGTMRNRGGRRRCYSGVLDWSASCLRLWISKEWDVRGHTSWWWRTPIGLRPWRLSLLRRTASTNTSSTWNTAAWIHISFGLCYGNSSSLPWWRGCTKLRLTSWDHRGRRGGWHRKHLSRRGCPIVVVVVTWSHQIGGWRREGDITIVMECSIHRYVRWCINGDRS